MSIVERYQEPIRSAFRIINIEIPSIDQECALQYAVKSVNDSFGPEGLLPTLLVYGALPRLRLESYKPAPTMSQRAQLYPKQVHYHARISHSNKYEAH